MRTAFSYIRFSSPEQAKGNSLSRQLRRTEEFSKQMGWALDSSTYRDLGCSGFKAGKQLALAAFLRGIEEGLIPKGSVLIVEALDRLSRANIDDAYELFRQIIKAGVDIAVETRRKVYTKSSLNSPFELMEVIVQFSLANEESAKKSFRTKDNWMKRRQKAKQGKIKAYKRCPCWIDVVDGKYKLNAAKKKIIRRIFSMCIDGLGAHVITRALNDEGIENIANGSKANCQKTWNQRYVEAILSNRQTFGENTLCVTNGNKRVADEVIEGFYPAAISAETFYAAQAARQARFKQRGPRGAGVANLFQGLIFDADSRQPLRVANSSTTDKRRGVTRRLATYHAHTSGNSISWDYQQFENNFLRAFKEITAERLTQSPSVDPVQGILSELAELQNRIDKTEDQIVEGGEIPALASVLRKLHDKQQSLEKELTAARTAKASKKRTQAENVLNIIELLDTDKTYRDRFKSLLRQMVNEIWVKVVQVEGNRQRKVLICQILFHDGTSRDFALYSYRGNLIGTIRGGKAPCRPEEFDPVDHTEEAKQALPDADPAFLEIYFRHQTLKPQSKKAARA